MGTVEPHVSLAGFAPFTLFTPCALVRAAGEEPESQISKELLFFSFR